MNNNKIQHLNNRSLKLLLIEDSIVDAYTVTKALGKNMSLPCEIQHVQNVTNAEIFLAENKNVDMILLGLGLSDTKNGQEAFQRIHTIEMDVPIIVLTEQDEHDLAVTLVDEGAEDYIQKSKIAQDPERISDTIEFAVCRHRDANRYKYKIEDAIKEKNMMMEWVSSGYSVK